MFAMGFLYVRPPLSFHGDDFMPAEAGFFSLLSFPPTFFFFFLLLLGNIVLSLPDTQGISNLANQIYPKESDLCSVPLLDFLPHLRYY